ncbi:uncharacterized protein LOC132702316 [Cylas formicarius]|uniref:uncharacterized protein LOC132702316 n=1 Tax=Cylas formicarius TaxID=197179 RepID=UPI0029588A7E|nr:uncharacterized protein LOC132702316 [Cylas formicarius]
MISRRRILSRSRDDLPMLHDHSEDVWYQTEKLLKDHIEEVLNKWTQIDDEIWAKVIVFEKNRRVAKAYARTPVLSVNGSDSGFDGFRIGLAGFDNPYRDRKTEECRRHVGHGVKIKMDESGNILIKRVSRSHVYIKSASAENAMGRDLLRLPSGTLEPNKPVKLFDMKRFESNVFSELKRSYPDRKRLELQCVTAIVFVKAEAELLKSPLWLLLVNIVALDMLKSRLSPGPEMAPPDPVPDENPYSVASHSKASSSSVLDIRAASSRADEPPLLPPRKNPAESAGPPFPPYENTTLKRIPSAKGAKPKIKDRKGVDDPYYCGLRARIPNFVAKLTGRRSAPRPQPRSTIEQHVRKLSQAQQPRNSRDSSAGLWHARSLESGLDSVLSHSPYNHMFYRLHLPLRGFPPQEPGSLYVGDWD